MFSGGNVRSGAVHRVLYAAMLCLAALPIGATAMASRVEAAEPNASPDPNLPVFAQEPMDSAALMSWAAIDPNVMDLRTAVAAGPGCTAPGVGPKCTSTVASLAVPLRGVAAVNANYTNGDVPLGLAVADHVQVAADDPHTTTFCVGDRDPKGHAAITIGKGLNATVCRTAVSGEAIVQAGIPAIEGTGDAGNRARFWFSVQPPSRVQRTLIGLRADGTLVVAVASSDQTGGRSGMTLPEAAAWMIAHGAVQAIALDGGHMSDAWVTGRGDISPMERGPSPVKTALVLVPVLWHFVLAPPPPIPTPPSWTNSNAVPTGPRPTAGPTNCGPPAASHASLATASACPTTPNTPARS